MIKMLAGILFIFSACMSTGCTFNDPVNAEADILSATLSGDVLKTDPQIGNDQVILLVKQETDVTALAPEFVLTPGASISPASGTARDFTRSQTYTVTSENGVWQKEYTVMATDKGITRALNFENSEIKSGYYVFYELDENGEKQYIWATGNAGYSFMFPKDADSYPTVHVDNGHTGKAVKLQTLAMSKLIGMMSGIYLIPGNLYIGTFDAGKVMTDPMNATRFGLPCEFIPTEITGYYTYAPGEKFMDEKNKEVAGKKDTFSICAVVYETDNETSYLNGHDLLTNPNIVAMAEMPDSQKKITDQWTRFEIPFRRIPGKTVDPQKLAAGGYNLALVFTSSAEGDQYRGAVGSTLVIDDVRLIRED